MLNKIIRRFSISLKRNPLISIDELSQLPKENTKFVDCSLLIPKNPPYPFKSNDEIFQKRRIPGAVHLDINVLSDPKSQYPYTIPSKLYFIANMIRLNLSINDNIVLYDSYGVAGVSRAWFLLQTYGHSKCFILNGGLPAYEKSGLPLETNTPKKIKNTKSIESFDYNFNFKLGINHYEIQNYSYMLMKKYIDNVEIIDTRNEKSFKGLISEPGKRSGYVPKAKNFKYESLLQDPFTFASDEDLRKAFENQNINLDNFIINMCEAGVLACIPFVSQRVLGSVKNAVYDGSWNEYGSLPEYDDEEIERRIKEPVSQNLVPKLEIIEPGKTYSWCKCGLSRKVTFCDGSHRSTMFRSLKFTSEKDTPVKKLICRCKNTKNPPYCDFTHVKVMTNHFTGKKIFSGITCNRIQS